MKVTAPTLFASTGLKHSEMSSPLAFPQNVTLHFKHLSSTRVSKYQFDTDLMKVTVSFQLQSDKTRAYREYTSSFPVTQIEADEGSASLVNKAWVNVWTLHHGDMLSFVSSEALKPGSNEVFQVPTYN